MWENKCWIELMRMEKVRVVIASQYFRRLEVELPRECEVLLEIDLLWRGMLWSNRITKNMDVISRKQQKYGGHWVITQHLAGWMYTFRICSFFQKEQGKRWWTIIIMFHAFSKRTRKSMMDYRHNVPHTILSVLFHYCGLYCK